MTFFRYNLKMVMRRAVNTTVTEAAWEVFVSLTERSPYHAQTDVVSAALEAFGQLSEPKQLAQIAAVRARKRPRRRKKNGQ